MCRAFDDLGISALLDLDGKFASANENDLIGFGISKPVDIAGSQVKGKGKPHGTDQGGGLRTALTRVARAGHSIAWLLQSLMCRCC